MSEEIGLNMPEPQSDISWTINDSNGQPQEVIRLSKGKFFAMGKEIEDTEHLYERFCAWMSVVGVV